MINTGKLLTSLSALERYTNGAHKQKHHSGYLSVFHFNREFRGAAVANTHLKTAGNRPDSIPIAIEHYSLKDTVSAIRDSLFSRISSLSINSVSGNSEPVMIAFDYTD